MGLYKGQNIITGSYMLPRVDDNRQVNVSRKRIHKKREEQEKKEDEGREENKEAESMKNICH
jgi:cell division GTPase FtsZ